MPIIFALMIVMIGAQVISGIYALITPFMKEMGDVQHYNIAYYGAIASVERAELVLKNHTAGFEGSGGVINKTTYGPSSDFDLVQKKYFGLLAMTGNNYGIYWDIKNLSTNGIIPLTGKGDLDPDISGTGQNDFYRLTFDHSLQIALYKDNSGIDKYYTGYSSLNDIKPDTALNVQIRVPQKLCERFNNGTTCSDGLDNEDNIDFDGDGITDDIIVNRSLFGLTGNQEFTIFPTISISGDNSINDDDTAIREDVINKGNNRYNIVFDATTTDTNPIEESSSSPVHTQNPSSFNQSPEDAVSTGFNKVFSDTNITKLHAKFSLVNLLKYDEDNVYPYLEIKVENSTTTDKSLPDKYFYITGEGRVGKYDVRIKISKPVFETTAASDFTVLF